MAGIDPSTVRAFVAGVEQARGHADAAMASLDQLGTAGAPAEGLLDDVGTEVELLALTLQGAARKPTTHAAADAARDLSLHGTSDLRRALGGLRDAIGQAGGATDGAEVVRRASDVRAQLNVAANWHLDELVRKATDPMPTEASTLGALTDAGVFRSFDDAIDVELASVARGIDEELGALGDELSAIGRKFDADGRGGDDTLDDAIALDELTRSLESGSFLAALDSAATNSLQQIEGRAAELRAAHPLDDHVRGIVRAKAPDNVRAKSIMAPDTSKPLLLADEVTRGEDFGMLQFNGRGEGTRTHDLPLIADGAGVRVPRFADAASLASSHADRSWAILAHAEGGWQVVPVSVRWEASNYKDVLEKVESGAAALSGYRDAGVRVEALSLNGDLALVSRTAGLVDGAVAAAARSLDSGASAAKVRTATPGEHGLPESFTPLVDIEVPGGTFARASTMRLIASPMHSPQVVDGNFDDALAAARYQARRLTASESVAVVRLDIGRYGLVSLRPEHDASRGTVKRMQGSLEAGRVRSAVEHDVQALVARGGTELDLRPAAA